MNRPLVTVLMPARNTARYIGEAIASVLKQSFTDFELLIINDGSTDNTVEIIAGFNDPRIRVFYQPPAGIAAALNKGLQLAKGELVARFDSDDICFPQRLEKQAAFLKSNPGYVLTGSDAEYITETGEHLFNFKCTGHTHEEIMQQLEVYCPFIHSSVMYRRMPVVSAGGYSPHAHQFEDYLLWVRLQHAGKYHNIPEPLLQVRFNTQSVTIDEKWRSRKFRRTKKEIIRHGFITEPEGKILKAELMKQDHPRIKAGAYEALCGKKFLLDNYKPAMARHHLGRAIRLFPLRADNYALYMLSFCPSRLLRWLHKQSPNKI